MCISIKFTSGFKRLKQNYKGACNLFYQSTVYSLYTLAAHTWYFIKSYIHISEEKSVNISKVVESSVFIVLPSSLVVDLCLTIQLGPLSPTFKTNYT